MGYTHYWDHDYIESDVWNQLVSDARKIIKAAADIPLGNYRGEGSPELTDERIALNGKGEYSYESFILTPEPTSYDFCKTEFRPYDVVVTTILLRATLTIPGFRIRSDGEYGEDWKQARDAYEWVFGEPAPTENPFQRS